MSISYVDAPAPEIDRQLASLETEMFEAQGKIFERSLAEERGEAQQSTVPTIAHTVGSISATIDHILLTDQIPPDTKNKLISAQRAIAERPRMGVISAYTIIFGRDLIATLASSD